MQQRKRDFAVISDGNSRDITNAMGDQECTHIVFYTHGDNAMNTIEIKGEDGQKKHKRPNTVFPQVDLEPQDKKLLVTLVCCHWDSICGKNVSVSIGGITWKPLPVPQIEEGEQKGEIKRNDAYKTLIEWFNSMKK